MPSNRAWLSLLVLGFVCQAAHVATAQDDDDEFAPGVLGRYRAGENTIDRVDPDIAFVWDEAAPDPRLPNGSFNASWATQLLIRQEGTYKFHAYVQGDVSVEIDGITVLSGKQKQPGWISGTEIELDFGEKPIFVAFRKTESAARVSLFWSSSNFGLEPVPGHLLFLEGGHSKLAQLERGRIAFDAHRCNRCHRRGNDSPSPPAPSLAHITAGTDRTWLLRKIREPVKTSEHAKMPSFDFSFEQARAVAAFLVSVAKPLKLDPTPQPKDAAKDRRSGQVLLRSLGCLACHTHFRQGTNGPYGGGDLSVIAQKRSRNWLATWLKEPMRLNQDHRMPLFKLTDSERMQLVLALTEQVPAVKPFQRNAFSENEIGEGRKLVQVAGCAACHHIPTLEPPNYKFRDLSRSVPAFEKYFASQSCVRQTARARGSNFPIKPAFKQIDEIERDAIAAYVRSRFGKNSQPSRFAAGQRVLEQRNCLACHERGQTKGIVQIAGRMSQLDNALRGQSQGLIPPALTAVGDKLHDVALAAAVSGLQKTVRLPWLRVRMPQFKHSDSEKSALMSYLVGHDRIPDKAPQTRVAVVKPKTKSSDSQVLLSGHTLVGAKGFSCIACHQAGSYSPRNVALGTRGSDLLMLAGRMRESYFLRWTRSPLRIVPGMEMPSYEKPVAGILGGDVDAQLKAIWKALNDKRFTVPTDPASVEQYFVVEPGAPARIVRDVFTGRKDNGGGYVARAMAIGLNNGHSLLYDLDQFALRDWTVGDFARQRTSGKSWYWDMAGVPVMSGFSTASDFALRKNDSADSPLIAPKTETAANGWLIDYEILKHDVRVRHSLNFAVGDSTKSLQVTETFKPIRIAAANGHVGWNRRIEVASLPENFDLLVARPKSTNQLGSTEILAVANGKRQKWSAFPGGGEREFVRLHRSPDSQRALVDVGYLSSLQTDSGKLNPKKPPTPTVVEKVTTTPGFDGIRLPIRRAIMPTAMTWTPDGKLAFTSLKGHVYVAHDTDGDGLEDKLTLFEEGLSAPFGIVADGDDLIVSHKPEVLRLRDTNDDGRADVRTVVATGWGHSDNYHDWVYGIVRDKANNLYIGLGSDYAQAKRPRGRALWRGKILRIDPKGFITPVGHSFRYPVGLAINAAGQIFVSDNQGVQNTFNEINHLVTGKHYGVPSRYEEQPKAPATPPAIQVPHPWTRSVNGLFFLSDQVKVPALVGHGIGCEYDSRFLIRFSFQKVGDALQGATYYFSRPNSGLGESNFVGPICGAVSPAGDIYIGNIHDSGWLGGLNTGSITRLKPNGKLRNGIRELRATSDGFKIEFISAVDATAAALPDSYTISAYTRVWKGGYGTPDSGRHRVTVKSVDVSADSRIVRLHVDRVTQGYVYEVSCGKIGADPITLWPATGHYTMNRIPKPSENGSSNGTTKLSPKN